MKLKDLCGPGLRADPEYQSAVVRLGLWAFSAAYIGLGASTGYYAVDLDYYRWVFGGFLVVFLALAVSVVVHPANTWRRHVALVVDVSAASLAIFLTKEAISPFYLLYIWLFISYGTRYGDNDLKLASVFSVVAYNLVLLALNEWQKHTFEAFFFLMLLVLLPVYQHSLLRKLHEARREAERANQAKSDFLATMTHELRTPLSGVIGMTRLLASTPLQPDQRDYVNSIDTSAKLLHALIGDVLDLSKIEAQKLQLEFAPIDVRELVLEVCNGCEGAALDKGLELVCSVDPALPPELVGDPLRLRQILLNLLGNAVKFTERGEVAVAARLCAPEAEIDKPHLCLEVRDTGIGISEDKLAQVFDNFWQADDSTSRRYGGTGLGTAIARDLTRLMNGHIEVQSEPGVGTRFLVRLPLLPEPPAQVEGDATSDGRSVLVFERNLTSHHELRSACRGAGLVWHGFENLDVLFGFARSEDSVSLIIVADSPAGEDLDGVRAQVDRVCGPHLPVLYLGYHTRRRDCCGEHEYCLRKPFVADRLSVELRHILDGRAVDPDTPRKPVAPPHAAGGCDVLVAEDNTIAARVLETFLGEQGHRVTLTKDGEETLQRIRDGAFHIAFVDLRMPRIDGFELTRRVRAGNTGDRALPIVALTANAAEDVKQQAFAAGMDEFLTKPVEPETLAGVIARLCGARS